MKKEFKIVLSSLLCLSLVGCGSKEDSNGDSDNPSSGTISGSESDSIGGDFIISGGDGSVSGDVSFGGDGDISFGDDSDDDSSTNDGTGDIDGGQKFYDENGNLLRYVYINDYGYTVTEYYRLNGSIERYEMYRDDAGTTGYVYNENQDVLESYELDVNGTKTASNVYTYIYYGSGQIKMYTETTMEGSYFEEYLLESGQPYKSISRDVDGNEIIEDYIFENGVVTQKKTSFADGSFSTITYLETSVKEVFDLGDGCHSLTIENDGQDPTISYYAKDGSEFDNEMDWKTNHWQVTH